MGAVTRPAPSVERAHAPERSREEVLAELERVVSRAKSGWSGWGEGPQPVAPVTDDLLPKRRKR